MPKALNSNWSRSLSYNEETDIYSHGVTNCKAANAFVPFSKTTAAFMLLRTFRNASF